MRDSRKVRVRQVVSALVLVALCVVAWHKLIGPQLRSGRTSIEIPRSPVAIDGLYQSGSDSAHVAMIVVSDFECPFCGRFAREVLPDITRRYVETGRLLLVFDDLPLEGIHPRALRRSMIAECAGRQGHFWDVHDLLFLGRVILPLNETASRGLTRKRLSLASPQAPIQ